MIYYIFCEANYIHFLGIYGLFYQNFTKNSALNDLLNETARGDTNTESGNSPVSLAQPFSTGAPMSTDTTGMPAEVASAVTRDYSDLMKAIDKKKGK